MGDVVMKNVKGIEKGKRELERVSSVVQPGLLQEARKVFDSLKEALSKLKPK